MATTAGLLRMLVAGVGASLALLAGDSQALPAQGAPPAPSNVLPPAAQSTPPQTPAVPALRTTTRLVQVAVVAHKKGVPVADLTESDFKVFDNGQEQKVQFFVKDAAGALSAGTRPLPPGTWSNQPRSRKGIPPNITVILYDGLNTRVTDQAYAREKIVQFLSHLRPEDRVALYTLGKDLRVLHDFTSDASSLLAALSKYKGYSGLEVTASDPELPNEYDYGVNMPGGLGAAAAALNQFLEGQDEVFAQYQIVNQASRTVDAMEAIAAHVAGIPGRKSLIWISGAFPFTLGYDAFNATARTQPLLQHRDFSADVERAARALADANVAVYPVDAHGLVVNVSAATRSGQAYRRSFSDPTPRISEDDLTLQTMDVIAERTGGRAFYRTNDFSGAIRSAIDDSQVTYTLAYAPSHNDWNGKFRAIKVTSTRPGVELRYRTGYFAVPDKPLAPTESQHMAAEAQWSSLEATEIGMIVRAVRTTVQGRPAMNFILTVDSAGLRFTEQDGRHTTDLLLLLAQKATDGSVVTGNSQTLALKLKDDTYQTTMNQGLKITAEVVLDPAAAQVRMVILDNSTGRLGSVDVPIAGLQTKAEQKPVAAPPPTPAERPEKP